MNANFDFDKNSSQKAGHQPELDSVKRDRFELLSAYLDGEVTAAERQQVQAWLDTDPCIQKLYQRLLKLRQGVHSLPVVTSQQQIRATAQAVFHEIDRRRLRKAVFWGGSAIAALVIGAVSELFPTNPLAVQHHLADSSKSQTTVETLAIAINQPVIEIPKAAVNSNFKGNFE